MLRIAALLLVIATATLAAPLTIPLPGSPFMSVPTADGRWVFVSLTGRDNGGLAVLRRSGESVELVRKVPVKGGLTGLVLTHDGKSLIGTDGLGVVVMDVQRLTAETESDAVIAVIHERGPMPGAVYTNVTRDDKLLFVSNENAQSISVIDLPKRAVIGRIPVGFAPVALRFSADDRLLYTTSQSAPPEWKWPVVCEPESARSKRGNHAEGAVIVIDVARSGRDPKHAVVSKVAAGCNPVRLALAPDGDRLYVSARGSHALLAFKTAALIDDPAHALLAKTPVGTSPVPVIVTDGGKRILIGNSNRFGAGDGGTLSTVDTATMSVTGSIACGAFPRDLAFSPDGHTLYVANYGSRTLQIMSVEK